MRSRAVARLAQARDEERDVVDSAPALSEEAVEEPVVATRLQDLEAAAILEAPLPERVHVRGPAVRRRSAQLAHEERRSVGHPRNGDGDVVEADPPHRELAQDGDPVALDERKVDLRPQTRPLGRVDIAVAVRADQPPAEVRSISRVEECDDDDVLISRWVKSTHSGSNLRGIVRAAMKVYAAPR